MFVSLSVSRRIIKWSRHLTNLFRWLNFGYASPFYPQNILADYGFNLGFELIGNAPFVDDSPEMVAYWIGNGHWKTKYGFEIHLQFTYRVIPCIHTDKNGDFWPLLHTFGIVEDRNCILGTHIQHNYLQSDDKLSLIKWRDLAMFKIWDHRHNFWTDEVTRVKFCKQIDHFRLCWLM